MAIIRGEPVAAAIASLVFIDLNLADPQVVELKGDVAGTSTGCGLATAGPAVLYRKSMSLLIIPDGAGSTDATWCR